MSNKLYDFKKAKKIIEGNKDEISGAYLGMFRDWYWTAEEVFGNGIYTENLEETKKIAGIPGSEWDVPTLRLYYKDGKEQSFDCFKEVSDEVFIEAFEEVRKQSIKSLNSFLEVSE